MSEDEREVGGREEPDDIGGSRHRQNPGGPWRSVSDDRHRPTWRRVNPAESQGRRATETKERRAEARSMG